MHAGHCMAREGLPPKVFHGGFAESDTQGWNSGLSFRQQGSWQWLDSCASGDGQRVWGSEVTLFKHGIRAADVSDASAEKLDSELFCTCIFFRCPRVMP